MKILCISANWIGGLMSHLTDAFRELGHEAEYYSTMYEQLFLNKLKLHQIKKIDNWMEKRKWEQINNKLNIKVDEYKPDLLIILNNSYILPKTIIKWKKSKKFKIITLIADFPFDSFRFSYLPYNLPYNDYIFTFDRAWYKSINNVAPNTKVESIFVGFNPNMFKDVEVDETDKKRLKCELAFTGESYGERAEGGYRCAILNSVSDFDLKLWGDDGWKYQFEYYPNLIKSYQGGRLSYDDLYKLYKVAEINLNMPSPQIITAFQPRIMEIGGCKGFQIADEREDLRKLFSEDELITFTDLPDLKEKIKYFIQNPEKKEAIVNKFFENISQHHTWKNRAIEILNSMNIR